MKKKKTYFKNLLLDLVPALGGLIGKISLIASFALVWATELNIDNPNFVFNNIRLEIIIASIIVLVFAIFFPDTAPAGTLAPLVVLIPVMVRFGAHPFILSILVGILGIISIKTNIFNKLLSLSGDICKISLTLMFGISGIILSVQKLLSFFENRMLPFFLLIIILGVIYSLLLYFKKAWLIIPIAAAVSLLFAYSFGTKIDTSISNIDTLQFNPIYWWEEVWGIGFGFNIITIFKTLPFALFIILLWTIDTLSIQAIIHSDSEKEQEAININRSFIAVSIRNIIGGIFGGAQTASLWRSFLIPLHMMKRPMRNSAILLGVIGILAGITAIPIKILYFPPLVWTVLMFGIFLPFIITGIKGIKQVKNVKSKIIIIPLSVVGIIFNPILTWLASILFEKFYANKHEK